MRPVCAPLQVLLATVLLLGLEPLGLGASARHLARPQLLGAGGGVSSSFGSSSSSSDISGLQRQLLQANATAGVDAAAAAVAAGYSSEGAVLVSTAAQLVTAIADPAVRVAVLAKSVLLTEADWAPVAQPVVELRRNVTIMGPSAEPTARPTLNLGYTAGADEVGFVRSAKVRIAPGCALTLRYLVVENTRDSPHWLFVGLDIVAASPVSNSTQPSDWPVFVMQNTMLRQRTCLPVVLKGASSRGIPRVPFMPGVQNGTGSYLPDLSQCVNSTNAPPVNQCWPGRGMYYDLAMFAYDQDPFNRQTPAGYVLRMVDVPFWCDHLMTDECVASKGSYLACYYSYYPYNRVNATAPPSNATAATNATSSGKAAGYVTTAAGASAANNSSSSSVPVANAPPAAAYADGGGGGGAAPDSSSSSSILAPVLGGVLGGLAGIALVSGLVAAAVMYRRRRRRAQQQQQQQQPQWDKGSSGSSSGDNGCPAISGDCSMPCSGGNAAAHPVASTAMSAAGISAAGASAADTWAAESAPLEPKAPTQPQHHQQQQAVVTKATPFRDTVNVKASVKVCLHQDDAPMQLQSPATSDDPDLPAANNVEGVAKVPAALTVQPTSVTAAAGQGLQPTDSSGAARGAGADDIACIETVQLLPVVLGKGGFGRVVAGTYRGQPVAVKQLLDDACWSTGQGPWSNGADAGQREELLRAFVQEVQILGRCDHPNIARLLAVCLTPPNLSLVLERCETSLDKLIYGGGTNAAVEGAEGKEDSGLPAAPSQPSLMPLGKVIKIAIQVAQGLEYLHPTIVHRDLKPANVLINDADSPTPVAKLSDFGLARMRNVTQSTMQPGAGTAPYLAPECFTSMEEEGSMQIGHRGDIYSFGVLLWTMLSGKEPWAGYTIAAVAYMVGLQNVRLPLDPLLAARRCTPKLAQLISQCWDADPQRRPAAGELWKALVLCQQDLQGGPQA
ncbi:hypothetical protein HXX76_012840 [Chlamydomonas incerta]|uniref:Protein kinase domain-containing protein n=1 Tax=Chlamydomonas incerta TaxID=51695 RepID=A0A835SUD6_CHLIN|nr:hypothetical protein HXX76_012840 [Chlamydomonas incerta]|eukprot:KAG2426785.1 hypothetical protein HXX76_012840 [Chlamydomonas incerta]